MVSPTGRYEQIAAILLKYGFEDAAAKLLPSTIQWRIHKQKPETTNLDVSRRIRLALQELGPAYIKFGQFMSMRRELLSPDLIEELKLLIDQMEPVPFEQLKPVIEEYCNPIDERFVYLNKRPFASSSLGQTHLGKLKDGTVVALMVQRPKIREAVEMDLHILMSIAERAEKTPTDLQIFNFPGVITEFARQIMAELDFVRDGKNADLLTKHMKDFDGVRIPKIIWEYSGTRLLVMEYIKGVNIDKVEQIRKMGVDPKAIALLGLRAYMKQIFDDGFFHSDPSPVNLLVTPKGELVFLDFGLMGILRPEKRDLLLKLLLSIVDKDVDELIDVFSALEIKVREQWVDSFKDDLYLALIEGDEFNSAQPDGGAMKGVVGALKKYGLKVPMATMLMFNVIIMVQDDCKRLYPGFDFTTEAKTTLTDITRRNLLSQANLRKTGFSIIEAFQNAKDLPESVNGALKRLSDGSFTFKIARDDLEGLGNSIDRVSYKILLGLIVASIVIGMSLFVIATQSMLTPPLFQITILVYVLAIFLGIFSVAQLIRERDKR